jgi:cytochrome c peroxidase
MRNRVWKTAAAALALLALTTLALAAQRGQGKKRPPREWPELAGYEEMRIPADNPMTPAKVKLGKQLFYDTRLSGDQNRSCYSCHLKQYGLTDGQATAVGAYAVQLTRSSPTLWNVGYHSEFYWDGRSGSLEAQAKAAWAGGNMGASGKDGKPSLEDICKRLDKIKSYRQQFQEVFGGACAPDNVAKALAAFERTLVSDDSPWTRFRAGDQKALSAEARRGYELFKGKARCENCHAGLLLTDLQYHNTGIGMKAKKKDKGKEPDWGRYNISKQERDKGAFKTPTLLDIAQSAPYFHDGSVSTLEEAVDLMLAGGHDNPWLDTANLRPPVKLSKQERADLIQFLRELGVKYDLKEPELPR